MKWLLNLSILSLLFVVSSCSEDDGDRPQITGSGNIITESREFGPFSSVQISSAINADITFGSEQSVSVSADDNVMELVITTVEDNTLFIDLEDGEYNQVTVEFEITNPELEELTMIGANDVEVNGFENLERLDVTITGVGNLDMTGSAEDLIIISSGSIILKAFGFIATNCDIRLSGVGDAEINVTDVLSGFLNGAGDIFYKGNPQIDIEITGLGSLVDSN